MDVIEIDEDNSSSDEQTVNRMNVRNLKTRPINERASQQTDAQTILLNK